MTAPLTRRKLISTGVASAASLASLGVAAYLADRYDLIPPDRGGVFGVGETLTYAAQRILTWRNPPVREFARSQISKAFPVIGPPPEDETYQRHLASGFENWRLIVDGLVARPCSLSLADLQRCPVRTQITLHACEQGWSAIAEWTGVPLSHVLNLAGAQPQAKYVVFYAFDKWDDGNPEWESIDMSEAWHPQTLLAFAMNGQPLPTPHGAPLRLRVPRQMGYKSVKYLARMTVVDTVKNLGRGLGGVNPEEGYSWFAGI